MLATWRSQPCICPDLLLPSLEEVPTFNTPVSLEKLDSTEKAEPQSSSCTWGGPGWARGCARVANSCRALPQACWWTGARFTAAPSTPARRACLWLPCASRSWDPVKRDCASITLQPKDRQRVLVGKLYKTYLKTFSKWTSGGMSIRFTWKWNQYDRCPRKGRHPAGWEAGGRGRGEGTQGEMGDYPLSPLLNLHFKGNVHETTTNLLFFPPLLSFPFCLFLKPKQKQPSTLL